jgi:hypothetical protein
MGFGIKELWIFLKRLVDFHEIWLAGDATQGDLDVIIFNNTASIFFKIGLNKFKLD